MMDATPDPLAGLRDIHLPEAISFWPLAPGWWLLAAGLAALVVLGLWLRHRRLESVRRAAVGELDSLAVRYEREGDGAALAERLSALLRRVALVRFGRTRVARLHGEDWTAFLAEPGRRGGFPNELATRLEEAVYAGPKRNPEPEEVTAWLAASRRWIRSVS